MTNVIGLLRAPGPVSFRAIRAGMEVTRAKKLLADDKGSGALQSRKLISESDSELVVDVIDQDVPTRLQISQSKRRMGRLPLKT